MNGSRHHFLEAYRSFEHSAWANSLLKKPPGEVTGPTMHGDFIGNPAGRVPSHGERGIFKQAANQQS